MRKMSRKSDEWRILSIIPADGWLACFGEEEDTENEITEPLAAWALVESMADLSREMVGIEALDYCDFADTSDNFTGYKHAVKKEVWGI